MQTQNDPFQVGGSITSSKLTLGMIVTHLITGYASMDFLSSFSWDWSLLKGKMGCRPGAFILYFGCRYLGMLSIVATVIFLDAFPMVFLNPLRCLAAIAGGLSHGLAYCIVLLRIAFMFKKLWLCIVLDVLKFAFWGIILRSMFQTPAVLNQGLGLEIARTSYSFTVITFVFAASLFQALYVCRKEHHFQIREFARVLNREDVLELALLWAANVLTSVVLFIDGDPSGFSNFATSYLTFVVNIMVACRLYRKMLTRCDTCPAAYCAMLLAMRAVGRYIGARFGKDGLPTAEAPTAVGSEKRCPAPVHLFLHWLRKPPSERGSTDAPRRESEDVVPPMTMTQTTASRGPGMLRGNKQAPNVCFANSRSTYAHTSLYDSQDS